MLANSFLRVNLWALVSNSSSLRIKYQEFMDYCLDLNLKHLASPSPNTKKYTVNQAYNICVRHLIEESHFAFDQKVS